MDGDMAVIKPNRTLKEYQSENPLYQFMRELEGNYGSDLLRCHSLGIDVKEYISFITFELLVDKFENEAETASLRQYQKSILEESGEICSSADILDREKMRSKDLQLRRKFREAKLKRFGIADMPQYEQLHDGMKDRTTFREGYELSKIQNAQLEDKDDLVITKKFNLTRFADSSNVPGREIKEYYTRLAEIWTRRSEENDLEGRIIYAINLNKFENENLYGICYRIARYCFDQKIKVIPGDMEYLLLALTGAMTWGPIQIHKKPVLLVEKLLPSVINKSASDTRTAINAYVELQFLGIRLRRDEQIIENLSQIAFTLEDVWEFICYDYNTFTLYQNIRWDGKGQTISTLRKIAKIVATKPLG